MRPPYRVLLKLWKIEPFRRLVMVALSASLGIAAGRTMIDSVSGSVSVVDGSSMAPTYQPGARVYSGPISGPLRRGDIVLLADGGNDYALKRVVGMPGETLVIWRGYVFINKRLLREPYLPKYTYTFPDGRTERFVFEIGPDEYFVLGDNRPCSDDSRAYGAVHRKQIKSRVPLPDGALRAEFAPFTLPLDGKRGIRPIESL